MSENISLDQYLEKISRFADSDYGRIVREQFKDSRGTSELGMLASPTTEELHQLRKAVAIMTDQEKENAAQLTDEQMQQVASDAKIDPGLLAIFLNGFALQHKKHR
jgi:hypothetical protein